MANTDRYIVSSPVTQNDLRANKTEKQSSGGVL